MRHSIKTFILLFLSVQFVSGQQQQKPVTREQQIQELRKLNAQIEQKQKQIEQMQARQQQTLEDVLAIIDADRAEADRIGAKAARLFPDGVLDDFVPFPDETGFSIYSFTEISDYYYAPRIAYKNNSLVFTEEYKENGTHGFIANIGGTLIETIDEENRAFVALVDYQPPKNPTEIKSEISSNGLIFRNTAPVVAGSTYLVRAIGHISGDGIFAVKIHRKDSDGSIVIFIKTIKTFPSSEPKNAAKVNKNESESAALKQEDVLKIQNALLQKGFYDVTVDASTIPLTLRGTIPKGKMVEVIQLVQEVTGKPVRNEMTEGF